MFVVNQDGFVTQMKYQENDLKGLVWSINEDRDEKVSIRDPVSMGAMDAIAPMVY